VGYKSFGLVVLIAFIMGLVITIQSRPTLVEFGAEDWLPKMVSISSLQQATKKINTSMEEINQVTNQIKSGNGTIAKLVHNTILVKKLNSIIVNTDNASKYLAENMEALQHTFLLKKQFKKKSK